MCQIPESQRYRIKSGLAWKFSDALDSLHFNLKLFQWNKVFNVGSDVTQKLEEPTSLPKKTPVSTSEGETLTLP